MYQYLEGLSFVEQRDILLDILLKNIGIGDKERSQMHLDKLIMLFVENTKGESFVELQSLYHELNVLLHHLCHTYKVNSHYSEEIYQKHKCQISDCIHLMNIKRLLLDMVENYMQLIRKYSRRQYSDLIRLCMDYIDFHFSEQITLASMANQFSVSESYLSARFTKETKMNFVTYVNSVRVDYACTLLEKLQLPMQKVAELCGFSNSNYFARVFHREIGMSPSQYRKRKQIYVTKL